MTCKSIIITWFLNLNVAHLGLHTHELLNKEIGNIISLRENVSLL